MLVKIIFASAALALTALYSPGTLATCTTVTDSQWECLEFENSSGSGVYEDNTAHTHLDGPFTFSGTYTLSHPLWGTVSGCSITIAAYLDVRPVTNEAHIDVPVALSTGVGLCSTLSFDGFSWAMTMSGTSQNDVHDEHGSIHRSYGDLYGVIINYDSPFGSIPFCQSSLRAVEFGNDVTGNADKNAPSFLLFDGVLEGAFGNCAVSGLVTTEGFTDVNAW